MTNLENNNVETSMVDSTENKENTTKNNEVATETKEEKTFTQSDIDRIIAKTIAKERKRAEEEKTEAEKLAKMTAEEKARHEFEKEKEEFEKERQVYLREKLKMQVSKELIENGLPAEFSKYLTGEDAETSKANIDEFKNLFNNALEKLVNERLKGATPVTGGGATNTTMITKEQFRKMNILERQKLYERDRELFEQLSK